MSHLQDQGPVSELESLMKASKFDASETAERLQNSSTLEQRVHQSHNHHHRSMTKPFLDHAVISHSMQDRIQRPLTTYTSLGSPIHRPRKMSIGTYDITSGSSHSLQSRSRSNSISVAAVGGLPTLFLPPNCDELIHPFPSIDGNIESYDANLNTRNSIAMEITDSSKALIEAACVFEHNRALELEKQEEQMTADEIRQVLKRERARMAKIQSELSILRYSKSVSHQRHYPAEELLSDEGTMLHGSIIQQRKRQCQATEQVNK